MKSCYRLVALLLTTVMAGSMQAGDVLKIVGHNLENYFWSLDRGRTTGNYAPVSNYNTEEGRERKTQMIVNAFAPMQADIYVFNELECCAEISRHLAQRMSEATGLPYVAVEDGLSYDLNAYSSGLIKSGFIYRSDKVALCGTNVSTAVGYTMMYPNQMRMQTFETLQSHERFSLSLNHFKAGSTEEYGLTRVENANSLMEGLAMALDPDILIMGDLNCQVGEEAINNIIAGGYEEQLLKYNPSAYTYVYNNQPELIDHVLANESMRTQVTSAEVSHIANSYSVGRNNAFSDHDPYVVMLDLDGEEYDLEHYERETSTTLTKDCRYQIVGQQLGELVAAEPLPANQSYGYLGYMFATASDSELIKKAGGSWFTFEDAQAQYFYLKDSQGRYLYQGQRADGTYYNSVNVTTNVSQAHPFSVTCQSDGTYKILNAQSGYYLQCALYYANPEFAFWNTMQNTGNLPMLYRQTTTTGIDHLYNDSPQQEVHKVISNGKLLIVMPDGRSYTLQGVAVEK